MQSKDLDKEMLEKTEDIFGNNLAVTCPNCGKVFIVSGMICKNGRKCPICNKSSGYIDMDGSNARIEYE